MMNDAPRNDAYFKALQAAITADTHVLVRAVLVDMAAAWFEAQGIRRSIKAVAESENALPAFNAFGDGFVRGYNTNPDNRIDGMTWHDYLGETYG